MYIKSYNCHTKEININYLEKANNLAEKLINEEITKKLTNKNFFILFDYSKT